MVSDANIQLLMKVDRSIVIKRGLKPGKTVAVFAGIHGNELAGVMALGRIIEEVEITAGTAYFVIANPPAVKKKTRMINKNLNRCFFANNTGTTWEDKRARQLMKLLDNCEALLDLHGYNGPEDTPFVISDSPGLKLASKLDFASVLTGISDVANGGTDCYMTSRHKVGLCLECGSNFRPKKYVSLAVQSVYTFLASYGLISAKSVVQKRQQTIYKVDQIVKRLSDDFEFNGEYSNFQALEAGKQFARDGKLKFIAKENQYIIFPRAKQKIGEESFILISKVA